jgi:hypothetical protein
MKCAQHYGERSYEGHVVSFFFNARGVELQKSTQGMYRSLIHQLLKKKKEQLLALPKHKGHSRHFQLLENLIEKSPQNKSHLAVELLKDMLRDLVLAFSPAQMVPSADALDDTETAERYGKSVFCSQVAIIHTSRSKRARNSFSTTKRDTRRTLQSTFATNSKSGIANELETFKPPSAAGHPAFFYGWCW